MFYLKVAENSLQNDHCFHLTYSLDFLKGGIEGLYNVPAIRVT